MIYTRVFGTTQSDTSQQVNFWRVPLLKIFCTMTLSMNLGRVFFFCTMDNPWENVEELNLNAWLTLIYIIDHSSVNRANCQNKTIFCIGKISSKRCHVSVNFRTFKIIVVSPGNHCDCDCHHISLGSVK